MKFYVIMPIVVSLLVSCTSESNATAENKSQVTPSPHNAAVSNDTVIQEVKEIDSIYSNKEPRFFSVEDYAALRTRALLYESFDSSDLTDDISFYAEGTEEYQTTLLVNPLNKHKVKYCWMQNGSDSLAFVEVGYFQYNDDYGIDGMQSIPSESGVYLGMTIKDLEVWNGQAIQFSGFSWDYGGTIFITENSKLAECNFSVTLGLYDQNSDTDYSYLIGDTRFQSNDSGVTEAPIIVEYLTYYWPSK